MLFIQWRGYSFWFRVIISKVNSINWFSLSAWRRHAHERGDGVRSPPQDIQLSGALMLMFWFLMMDDVDQWMTVILHNIHFHWNSVKKIQDLRFNDDESLFWIHIYCHLQSKKNMSSCCSNTNMSGKNKTKHFWNLQLKFREALSWFRAVF